MLEWNQISESELQCFISRNCKFTIYSKSGLMYLEFLYSKIPYIYEVESIEAGKELAMELYGKENGSVQN